MREGRPVYKAENFTYLREEKDGYWMFISKYRPELDKLIINATSKEILDLCNGQRSQTEIIAKMKENYPQVAKEKLAHDVEKTLARFSRLMIIKWEGENPFLFKREQFIADDYLLKIATEKDLKEILKLINKPTEDKLYYRNPFLKEGAYKMLALRQKIFNYSENFFLLKKDEQLVGLISIALPVLNLNQAGVINLIIAPKDKFSNLLNYALDYLPYIAVTGFNKVKLNEAVANPLAQRVEKELKVVEFKIEGQFKNELGFNQDVRQWSWLYQEDYLEQVAQRRLKF